VMMLMQSGAILDILMGRDGGWSAQQRDDASFTGGREWWDHRWHIAIGVAAAIGAWAIGPALFWLTAPVWLGLITSAPLSILTSSRALGRASLAAHLFVTPEEAHLPAVVARARQLRSLYAWEAGVRARIADLMCGTAAIYRLGQTGFGAAAIIQRRSIVEFLDAKAA